MKKSIEYLGNVNAFTTKEELYNIGKQMQIDAINASVEECANKAEYTFIMMILIILLIRYRKQSILKTAEQLISQL